jgi:molecular chaperone HtpG
MANINIPKRLKDKLDLLDFEDEISLGIIIKTLGEFGEILTDNKLYFFEEYTDHGIKHIENVIVFSDNLITDDTYALLNPKDVGAYVLSVVLHDIAMHISLDGFLQVISGAFDDVRVLEFDKFTWKELWEEYLNEAKKFNPRQLEDIFGEDDIVIHAPVLTKGGISGNDKKLIGEFIRRHHPRLAHEIALKGFPGGGSVETGQTISPLLPFADGLNKRLKDLIGLIARSHGMGLRDVLDHIEEKFKGNKRHPLGIHAIYLMVLLRIADYIQIDNSRTSATLIKLKTFSSPFSAAEHQSHLSIENIDIKYQDDPERIYVAAYPADSNAYLKLKKLIKDIQYEMDISWAVLGEHYGATERPEMKYRRIVSNLDEKGFINTQSYVADNFSFNASGDILQLMIKPLYGDHSSYGVRELIQNAVDACKERTKFEPSGYKPLITVDVSYEKHGEEYFTITDNGIGMNPEIIKNYFLTAGVSYRKSINWKKEFVDSEGHTTVRRNGKFGVGLLAAFLIGEEIEVMTRKAGDDTGYRFTTSLNTPQINIAKDASIAIGTSIRIKIYEDKREEFDQEEYQSRDIPRWFKWYRLYSPSIKYSYWGEEISSGFDSDPDLQDDLPIDWEAFDAEGFNKILWTYDETQDIADRTCLSCNGIVIPVSKDESIIQSNDMIRIPRVSVFDYEGNLPITLNRNGLSDRLPFEDILIEDVYKDFIAFILSHDGLTVVNDKTVSIHNMGHTYPAPSRYENSVLLFSKKGFLFNSNYCVEQYGAIDILYIESLGFNQLLELDLKDAFIKLEELEPKLGRRYGLNDILRNSNLSYADENENLPQRDATYYRWIKEEHQKINTSIYLQKHQYDYVYSKNNLERRYNGIPTVNETLKEIMPFKYETGTLVCLHLENPATKPGLITPAFLEKYASSILLITEYRLEQAINIAVLDKLLEKYLGKDVLIPYSMEERKKKFPYAFRELDRYMKKYE